MDKKQNKQLNFGLVGKDIDYSFSRYFFSEKFKNENLPHTYQNIDIKSITEFESRIKEISNLSGLNVTIPYKEAIIPYLDELDNEAESIGAVNTIKISEGKLIGYNTDYYGFKTSLSPCLKSHHKRALIFGTGGASKAIVYALKTLGISCSYVSRTSKKEAYTYSDLTEHLISEHSILINCTPVGTYPDIDKCHNIPYGGITDKHIAYDLIYNPNETKFLRLAKQNNAIVINGLKMLELQALKSWEIWNSNKI